jgi:di/tricarboxylate transporter
MKRSSKAVPALITFILAISAAASGLVSIQLALGMATVAMALLNIVPVREFYDGVDWPVVILLGAMIPLGAALETTGTTSLLVDGILSVTGDLSPAVIVALILIITMTVSDVLNNAATAILMAPIAYSIAVSLQLNPDAFLMAVAVGASCAFLTPIGHQNNALIMGPGGYQFGDYWRMGLPLEIIIVVVAVPLLLIFWPL